MAGRSRRTRAGSTLPREETARQVLQTRSPAQPNAARSAPSAVPERKCKGRPLWAPFVE